MLTRYGSSSQAVKAASNSTGAEASNPRVCFTFGDSAALSATAYLKNNGALCTATLGIRALRAGSVIGISAQVSATAVTQAGTLTLAAKKGGNNTLTVVSGTISETGQSGMVATAAQGVHTFVAGDILNLHITFTSFTGTLTGVIAFMEVVFNS